MLRDTLEHVGWAFGQEITENVVLFIHCHDNRNLLNIKNINRYVASGHTVLLEMVCMFQNRYCTQNNGNFLNFVNYKQVKEPISGIQMPATSYSIWGFCNTKN